MQKKRVSALFLALALVMALAVSAAPRYVVTATCDPTLSISGTTASVGLRVDADKNTDIEGILTLYRGSAEVESWDISGTTSVRFSNTAKVTRGYTSKLVADLTVTGSNGSDDVYEYVTKEYR